MSLTIIGKQRIPDLGKRLEWLAQNTIFERKYVPNGKLDKISEIEYAICSIMKLSQTTLPDTKTFYNYFHGKTPAAPSLLSAICTLFPCVSLDWLVCGTQEEFELRGVYFKAEMDRWKKATMEVAKNRALFEHMAMTYHRPPEDTSDFPLVTRPGWLLDPPVELTKRADHPPLCLEVPDVTGPKLFHGHGDYASVKRSGVAKWFNGLTFRVLDIKAEGGSLAFTFGKGDYEDYVNTCEYRGAELADAHLRGRPIEESELPHRGKPEAIFDFAQRSAFPGVNCVVFLKGYEDDTVQPRANYFAMHLRGKDVLEAQNTNHVVPAGGHQPGATTYGPDNEQDIWQTAVREFVEELFNKKEVAEIKRGGNILAHQQVQRAVDAIFLSGRAKVFLLGVGLDPLTTKPEILVAIVVDWWAVVKDRRLERYVTERSEDDGRDKFIPLKIKENYEGVVRFPPLSRESLEREAAFPHDKKPVLPAGAACLRRAAMHYEFLIKQV